MGVAFAAAPDGLQRHDDLAWLEPKPALPGCSLVFTTRLGGRSLGDYEGLNLGFHVGDVEERVRLHRRALRRGPLARRREPVSALQVHGANVRSVGVLHAGANWEQLQRSLPDTDGLVTTTPDLPLMILVADCLAVAIVDRVRGVLGVAHAGWRGLAAGVLANTLACMTETWQTAPADCVAWIGPAIGPCCYQVGADVAARFSSVRTSPAGLHLDLRAEAVRQLAEAGMDESSIGGHPACTSCRADLFYSHRRATQEGCSSTGRQALIAWLSPST